MRSRFSAAVFIAAHWQDRLPGGGGGKSLRGPVEQGHTETFLKESDTPPHGNVVDAQSASGRRHREHSGDSVTGVCGDAHRRRRRSVRVPTSSSLVTEGTATPTVLDVGSGVGGPARFLAANCGCQVTGVDLSEPFVDAARYLTERTGQSGQVSYRRARRSRRQGCRAPPGSTRRAPAGACAERDARGDDRRKLVSRFVSGYTSRRP